MVSEICFKAHFSEDWEITALLQEGSEVLKLLAQVAKYSVTNKCQLCPVLQREKMSLRDLIAVLIGTENTQMGGSLLLRFFYIKHVS